MEQRLQTLKFTFTVEGNTEKWYLEWLEGQINNNPKATCKVQIEPIIETNPFKYAKRTTVLTTPEIYHICDIESNSDEHKKKFENVLKNLKDAKSQKKIDYSLGYSNFTFELWIILHKKDCLSPLADRKQYLEHINSAFGSNYMSLKKYKEEKEFKSCLQQLTIDDVIKAIKRSEKIMKNNKENGLKPVSKFGFTYYEDNPSLEIYEPIKTILEKCGII